MQTISQILAQELNCKQEYIENVIALLDEGNTIPFIARYRKEQHGAMDDTEPDLGFAVLLLILIWGGFIAFCLHMGGAW